MGLSFDTVKLLSRTVRLNLSNGKQGGELLAPGDGKLKQIARLIKSPFKAAPIQESNPVVGFFTNFLIKPLAGFAGWVFSGALSLLSFSLTALWGAFVQSVMFLWNFDWNASEDELQQMLGDPEVQLGAIWGRALGSTVGWVAGLAIGTGVAMKIPVIGGGDLAKKVAVTVGEEAKDELFAVFRSAIKGTVSLFAKQATVAAYVNLRNWIKSASQSQLEGFFGKQTADFIKNKWGAKGGPSYTAAAGTEYLIKKIPNKFLRTLTETALEEAWESFIEAGFIVVQELDSAFTQHKLSQKSQLGEERTVTLQPDKTSDEVLTYSNLPQNLLMPAVQQTINTHRMIYNRDVGMLMGMPIDEYTRAKPQSLRIIIDMMSRPKPPYYGKISPPLVRATIAIPDLKRSALKWDKIKEICGGTKGYLWGRFRASADLDNGRQMVVYGGTEKEAEKRLKLFLSLSTAKLVKLLITEEKKEGKLLENPKLYKETTPVYPAFLTIINREELLDTTKGSASLSQNYRDRKARIPLYLDHEPRDFDEIVGRLLKKGV